MSLIIAAKCRDGIVLGCDTRSTIRNDKGIRYSDTTIKIVPFPNRCCVAFCGDGYVKKGVTVHQFLTEFREKEGSKLTISDLPIELLSALKNSVNGKDIMFLVCGYSSRAFNGRIYGIETKSMTIKEEFDATGFGATYRGITDICHTVMGSGINFGNMTIVEMMQLIRSTLNMTVTAAKFWDVQNVGGDVYVYVIHHYDDKETGWNKNGVCISDDSADVNALDKLRDIQIEQMMQSMAEEKAGEKHG